jgi:hypothetical protein
MYYLFNASHVSMLRPRGETFSGMSPLLTRRQQRRLGASKLSFIVRVEWLLPEKTML